MNTNSKPHKLVLIIGIVMVVFLIALLIRATTMLFLFASDEKANIDPNMTLILFEEGKDDWKRSLNSSKLQPGYFYVFAHGIGNPVDGAEFISDTRTDKTYYYSARDTAELIQKEMTSRHIPLSTPIFFMSCNTGSGKKPFAKVVSSHLQSEVLATDQWLIIDDLGITRTARYQWLGHINLLSFSYKRYINGKEASITPKKQEKYDV